MTQVNPIPVIGLTLTWEDYIQSLDQNVSTTSSVQFAAVSSTALECQDDFFILPTLGSYTKYVKLSYLDLGTGQEGFWLRSQDVSNAFYGQIGTNNCGIYFSIDGANTVSPKGTWSFPTTGVNILTGGVYKINATQVVGARQAALPADATDLASVIALANAIKAGVKTTGGHGLFAD